eukprot:SAG31_NODE_2535_length_5550_cov_3.770134_2_plen_61_part_00
MLCRKVKPSRLEDEFSSPRVWGQNSATRRGRVAHSSIHAGYGRGELAWKVTCFCHRTEKP